MNEKKLMKDINKWRNKLAEASERAKYINYMNQCPYYVEAPIHLPSLSWMVKGYPLTHTETPIPDYIKEAFNE